jgi:hypothetical protein
MTGVRRAARHPFGMRLGGSRLLRVSRTGGGDPLDAARACAHARPVTETEQARPALSAAQMQKADDDLGWWLEFGPDPEPPAVPAESLIDL